MSRLGEHQRSFLAALRFLTIIPVSRGAELDGEYFRSSLLFFPLIGLIIGGIGYGLAAISLLFLPQQVVACLVITFLAFISGCLHLDGLSDSGDGLLSSRPRERSMEIMKDSRVGAMGVIVTLLVILTKFSALSTIEKDLLPLTVFFMPFAGRVLILLTMAFLPYARGEGGLGKLFYSNAVRRYGFAGSGLFILILLILSPGKFFVVVATLGTIFLSFNFWCKSKLGGATGDTLGANCELAEMGVAVAFSVTLLSAL